MYDLRTVLQNARLSQEDLASLIGTNQVKLTAIETLNSRS